MVVTQWLSPNGYIMPDVGRSLPHSNLLAGSTAAAPGLSLSRLCSQFSGGFKRFTTNSQPKKTLFSQQLAALILEIAASSKTVALREGSRQAHTPFTLALVS